MAIYLDEQDGNTLIGNLPMPPKDHLLIQTIVNQASDAITSMIIDSDNILYLAQ